MADSPLENVEIFPTDKVHAVIISSMSEWTLIKIGSFKVEDHGSRGVVVYLTERETEDIVVLSLDEVKAVKYAQQRTGTGGLPLPG